MQANGYGASMSSTRSVPRLAWTDLPADVGDAFAQLLGSPVVEAHSQEEGFSPGMAARCRLADDRVVFLKATSSSINVHSREMMVHEGVVSAVLPADGAFPELLGTVEVGEWFGLAFADIDGRVPTTPWADVDLELVLTAVDALAVPANARVPPLTAVLSAAFEGWASLADAGADLRDVEPWLDAAMIRRLADRCAVWPTHCAPEAIVHADIRADNVLIEPGGSVRIVDWANAGLGPAWLDVVFMIPSISMQDGPQPEELWERSKHATLVDAEVVDCFVIALAGYFTAFARRPPVAEIPMLRDFQEAQAVWARDWVRTRLSL